MSPGKIEANPFGRQWAAVGEAALAAVRRVGESGWYVLGREVASFEGALAAATGRRHAVGCASGLDAIEIGLRALDLPRGAAVLTTPYSAFATTLAILRAGGVPHFVDVDSSGLLDLDAAAAYLGAHPEVRFAVPVHLFGHALDLERLATLRDRFELAIVEDCAQAIGARSREASVGSVGQVAALSFYPTKNLGALGDGGALLTDSSPIDARARRLRDYGQSDKYVHAELGLNSRLDELHAAVLSDALLPRLTAWTERRRAIARRYAQGLAHPNVRIVEPPPGSSSVWHLQPVRVTGGARDGLLDLLRKEGVQAAVHYPTPIPAQAALRSCSGVRVHGGLERATSLAVEELSLPIHPLLEDAEVDRVIELVNGWRP
jgi:dTDP-4-amino-4,6-dideoxygalactose transaminase